MQILRFKTLVKQTTHFSSLCFFAAALSAINARAATFQSIDISPGDGIRVDSSADGQVVVARNENARIARWTLQGGVDVLPHFPNWDPDAQSYSAGSVSADGSVITGAGRLRAVSGGPKAARWTDEMGWEILSPSSTRSESVTGVSSDGSVIVGRTSHGSDHRAFRWTEQDGMQLLANDATAAAVSGDGNIVVGNRMREAFRWTPASGAVGLGFLQPDPFARSRATAISRDGQVIAGISRVNEFMPVPYRWTEETGMVALGPPATNIDYRWDDPTALSADGSVIVGGGGTARGFIWDEAGGLRYFQRAMVLESGLGYQLAGWKSLTPYALSDDGRTIIGSGRNPSDESQAWIIRLDDTSEPQPPIPGVVEVHGIPVLSTELLGAAELTSFIANGIRYEQEDLIPTTLSEFLAVENNANVVVPAGSSVPSPGNRGALLTQDFQLDSGIVNPNTDANAASVTFDNPLVNGPGPDLVVFEIKRSDEERPHEFADPFQIVVNGITGVLGGSSWGPQLGTIDVDAYRREGGHPTSLSELENGDFLQPSTINDMVYYGVAIDLNDFGVAPMAEVSEVSFGGIGTNTAFDPVLFMGINSAQFIPEPSSLLLVASSVSFVVFKRQRRRHTR